MAFSARGTFLGSWYGHFKYFILPFSWAPGLGQFPGFNLLLTFTVLQRFIPVKYADKHTWLSPKRLKVNYRCRKRIEKVQEYEPVSLLPQPDYGIA